MKPNEPPEPDEPLRQVLRQWAVDTPLPPRFQEQVWQRIAWAEAPPAATVWGRFVRAIEVSLPRPQVAFSYLAALMVLGVAAGAWAAQIKTHRLAADLGWRYVQTIDPFAGALHP
jgi:hypothetical protein